ncbi:MarR family winged helix-turn-helix transcriptional regulator [Bosea lathyri]|uniref:Transcriptional regulator, MarR family n=1 Tax=Bosea lathyri TaxID=1036778 RepID=A0A1H5XHQ5_9HYPH|nr:MarR family transcriptional regulator [Bosea lathyri]SEG11281.1 transcriptional regulator, MarR family [Bosea lathyri]
MAIVCFCTTLRRAARRVAESFDAALAPIGINTAQFSLLRSISRAAPVKLTELSRVTELDRSTIGRNVRVLERMNLVALGRGKDQREAMVTLTEAGRAAITEGIPLWEAAQAAFEARLGTERAQKLRAELDAL